MKRIVRVVGTLLVTSLAVAYIVSKVDLGQTAHIIGTASVPWLLLSALLTIVTVPPLAWRWQLLLRARGIGDSIAWLTRAYFVSYAFSQVLPTGIGGDAWRIFETSRRHPGNTTPVTGSVLIERAVGGVVTLTLAAIGLLLAIGRYPVGPYLWVELLTVAGMIVAGFVFFSRSARRRLVFLLPLARRLKIERPARAVYEGLHGYRDHPWVLVQVALISAVGQVTRIVAIYASGRAVGIHLSLLPYIVLGPLLFLVLLVPFTLNGIGVREAFFVDFLGKLHVDPDLAFACGFLFFVMTIMLALPGIAILLWENVFGRTAPVPDGTV